ncbi:MAG: lipopolysaccharide core heptose(I) kinase RfaP [Aliifodinibius sp.]|nr:lipopolysaccharide core heptose(I) kinase RfaP [Fodinibius sp.]NIV12547.1 lipopolysaccharide core heptose(I) kinase RfaP [Fodinibius sp.]NIY26249.1 lipopolysaccharide core heptose(I) kinase RfaP [Fodinibius sp.]
MIYIREDLRELFKEFCTIDDFMQIDIDIVRDFKNRKTGRFRLGSKAFYIKKHFKSGVGAIINELLHLRKPHIGAAHERYALEKFSKLGIDTMKVAAFGQSGTTLANQRSFLVTDEIGNVESLERICGRWFSEPPPVKFKNALIRKVAKIAKTLHENGMNHRDFYICHFLLDVTEDISEYENGPRLFLIDLHRVQQRSRLPFRWRVKDIGGLWFSTMDINLAPRDIFRFMRFYTGKSLRQTFQQDRRFWLAVHRRAVRTYHKEFGKSPTLVIKD